MMKYFFTELRRRSRPLSLTGWLCLAAGLLLVAMMPFVETQVLGINALIKPSKFLFSTTAFTWAMAWYGAYLPQEKQLRVYGLMVIGVLTFENLYILYQAWLGELSHFNVSTPFHGVMFGLMGLTIGIMTAWTAYISLLFWRAELPKLPPAYRWGIRLGTLYFVVFAFAGYQMADNLAHTVGAPDGGAGLPYVNWSTGFGDLRVAHFLGMHALQILPIAGYYLLRKPAVFLVFAVLYLLLVIGVYYRAVNGVPMLG